VREEGAEWHGRMWRRPWMLLERKRNGLDNIPAQPKRKREESGSWGSSTDLRK
jgi:hypothetical protein